MKTVLFIGGLFLLSTAQALTSAFAAPTTGIFSGYDVLDFKLTAPISTLLNAKKLSFFEVKKVSVQGTLSYTDNNQIIQIPVKINIKGFTSTQFCTLPKLELKLDKALKQNTLFANVKSIDLHTHCVEQDDATAMDAVKASFTAHREALIYRFMDVLEIPAFRARPIMMAYEDTDTPSIMQAKTNYKYQAFFLEDYGDFRKRNNLKAIRGVNDITKYDTAPDDLEKLASFVFTSVEQHSAVDRDDVARAVLFQNMIGNGDYFIQKTATGYRIDSATDENLWNMKLVENAAGKWITIPQDFNFSLITTSHQVSLPLEREGWDLASAQAKQNILTSFKNKKSELLKAAEALSSDADVVKIHLERFFLSIENLN